MEAREIAVPKSLRVGYLVGSVVFTLLMIVIGWYIIYKLAIIPLAEEWSIRISGVKSFNLSDTRWWRNFIALVFDLLILVIGIIGTWWVLARLVVEAREAGKWRYYYNSPEAKQDIWVERWSRWQRFQHIWVMITFTICAITGFATYLNMVENEQLWKLVHVYAGLAMGAVMLIHLVQYTVEALLAKARGESLRERFPMLEFYSKDFIRNVVRALLQPITGTKPGPYGKYDPEQLFEYWGVYWGMAVLGIPGLILTLKGPQVLGGILWVTHTKEAVLAVTFIIMVHIAYAHFRPTVFPMDPTFITGRMPWRRIVEEHPRWAEQLKRLGLVSIAKEEPSSSKGKSVETAAATAKK